MKKSEHPTIIAGDLLSMCSLSYQWFYRLLPTALPYRYLTRARVLESHIYTVICFFIAHRLCLDRVRQEARYVVRNELDTQQCRHCVLSVLVHSTSIVSTEITYLVIASSWFALSMISQLLFWRGIANVSTPAGTEVLKIIVLTCNENSC